MRLNVACTPGGRLLTVSNSVCGNAFAYDAMDRLTSATTSLSNATYNVTYHRDPGGLATNVVFGRAGATTPPSIARTYDPDGRLVSVSDWLGHTWTFAWDGAGKPTGGTAPGGIVATNHYDAAGRLAAWSTGSAGVPPAPIVGRTITRDLAGLKTRDDITAGPHPAPSLVRYAENTFDAADRLVTAQVRYGSHTNAAVTETYHYDGNGALTNLVAGSKVMSTGTAGILARTVYSFACTPPSTRERRFLSSQTIAAPPRAGLVAAGLHPGVGRENIHPLPRCRQAVAQV